MDGRRIRVYDIALAIAPDGEVTGALTSLLGQDILWQWYMRHDPTNDLLGFVVRTAITRSVSKRSMRGNGAQSYRTRFRRTKRHLML